MSSHFPEEQAGAQQGSITWCSFLIQTREPEFEPNLCTPEAVFPCTAIPLSSNGVEVGRHTSSSHSPTSSEAILLPREQTFLLQCFVAPQRTVVYKKI